MTTARRLGPLTHLALTFRDPDVSVHGGVVAAHYGSGLSFEDPDGIAPELFAPPAGG